MRLRTRHRPSGRNAEAEAKGGGPAEAERTNDRPTLRPCGMSGFILDDFVLVARLAGRAASITG
jgi:hypothetical protein